MKALARSSSGSAHETFPTAAAAAAAASAAEIYASRNDGLINPTVAIQSWGNI